MPQHPTRRHRREAFALPANELLVGPPTAPQPAAGKGVALDTRGRLPFQSAWTAYTPVLTATTTNPTLGSGSVQAGRWTRQTDRLVVVHIYIKFGTSGAAAGSGDYLVSLPVNRGSDAALRVFGCGYIYDDSTTANRLVVAIKQAGAGVVQMLAEGSSTVNNASPWTWANNDEIQLLLTYEAAA